MAKVSHSSDLNLCRHCGEPLDVYMDKERRVCSLECEEYHVGDLVEQPLVIRRSTHKERGDVERPPSQASPPRAVARPRHLQLHLP